MKLFESNISIVDFYKINKENFSEEFIILDSANKSKLSNYSYICAYFNNKITLKDNLVKFNNQIIEENIFYKAREILEINNNKKYKYPFYNGGLIGIISYDYNKYIEKLPNIAKDDLGIEDIYFVMPNLIIVKDEKTNEFYELNYSDKRFKWNNTINFKNNIEIIEEDVEWEDIKNFIPNMSKEQFEKIVEKAKYYIKEGDVFQVNLSQRFMTEFPDEDSFYLYEILRKINPSPFASFINLKEFRLISQSPERLVKLENNKIETRPIAGTRRIKKDNKIDNINFEKELKIDEKELAEHVMLVDLERNDIGKISKIGTVKVNEFMVIEKYSHVMHIVSNIIGELDKKYDGFDVINAMFPGGTITGAPKIRTMEIIEELEPTKRGFYTGSMGFIDFNGNIDFNIIIRSFIQKENKVYFQVGAGIVYDSDPKKEYKETINKARAMILAYKNYINNKKGKI
ncbi:aminodeoxychorismate synthase subunit I [Hypnocyclicus thermotrophus]|uniref:Aminodeoxychorismate synthase subunit I n=1 Tax=Hypnocyclicus thermotrophus TaxID=1627895 RepID=A0AA46DXQ7_9FUSO|nr:anthranilate synthase component I family protein [Hypnocyclicus thermotrophus]TDT68615.1 aminodeoxychorismate synthase subunit I [Hypnocyclicus thermotrophus]